MPNDSGTIKISFGEVFIWCPHDRHIGWSDGDEPSLDAFFCDECADAWDNGAAVVVTS